MNFKNVSPESVGISSKTVLDFIKTLDGYGFCTHSILMSRGENIFAEVYYAPFHKDYKHRMYSVSKSFVGVAVGMAIDDGLLSLEDKLCKFFPEHVDENTHPAFKETVIRDLLTMETAVSQHIDWFPLETDDRTAIYFQATPNKIPGTVFDYDSPGSFMLGAIVERVTGKPFLEYMKEKALNDIGFSQDSYCLKCPGGHSFGDSAVMCSSRDLLTFARFVMNRGKYNGKQYVNPAYMADAVSAQVCNENMSFTFGYHGYGYGYQIWKTPNDGFAFVGMGDQLAICDPKTDFIFIITSDNQGNSATTRTVLFHELYTKIINALSEPLPQDQKSFDELLEYSEGRTLYALPEEKDNPFADELNDKTYILESNKMGIEYFKLHFEGKKGTLYYKNAQGEKELTFGIGYNEFGIFPEEGYSDDVAGNSAPGNKYKCACSADWAEDKKLRIKVQIIDRYFGNGCFEFSFKDCRVSVCMTKTAENFMREYEGFAIGAQK